MPIKKVRTPGGKLVLRKVPKKTGKHVCGLCGKMLHGVPHGLRPAEVRKLAKTEKRPERIFGGNLCNKCVQEIIQEALLVKEGIKDIKEVSFKKQPYVKVLLKRWSK
jgi:large subunit ribosomal protein L34e